MPEDLFDALDEALCAGGAAAGFELLIRKFRGEKKYPLVFEARIMKSRYELGLPVIHDGQLEDLPEEKRAVHERAYMEAAHEVGGLFLADGDIPRAWSYFRAIGETAPVAAAIEQLQPQENQEAVIEIALHERVHPRKGFELILANYGICRAITFFEQYPDRKTREDCIRLLVRTLHHELVESIQRTIARNEGHAPETRSVPDLIAGRDWLFGEYDYYVDTSHLASVLRFSLDATDRETLGLAVELAEYGKHLASTFQFHGDPPFEDGCKAYAIYLRALIGENGDEAVAYFRGKIAMCDAETSGTVPAQTLVALLARLGRYPEAIAVSLDHLRDTDPNRLFCPSVFQLCQASGDYGRLRSLARERGDLLHFAAAALQS
ncbi:MAG: hypothetical protein LAP39_22285 [Acidobacteriia bacterium]|nr:hypothetical protein [Terriglobia bacterium]